MGSTAWGVSCQLRGAGFGTERRYSGAAFLPTRHCLTSHADRTIAAGGSILHLRGLQAHVR